MVKNGAHFDFVIVGGGTAGNTVAGRLVENPNVTILIVEAGIGNPQDIPEITTPSSAMDLRNSKYDWTYKITMVKRDDYERVEKLNTRGKTLGGSSSLNYFTWVPGCKPTFDMWEEYGGKEWTWDPLLPYLRKSVTYHDDPGLYSSDLAKIGSGGPIHISHAELLDEMAPFREAVTKAWLSRGHGLTENIYDGTMIGLTHCCDTIYKGTRSGSFLFVQNKPNITILPQVHSKHLIINDADRTCKGVTVIDAAGQELSFYADREVILSQVALVPFVLRVKDGYGMEDHLLRKGPKNDAVVAAYQKDRSGPVGSGLLELVGFPRIDDYLEKDEKYRRAKAGNGGKDPFCPDGQPHFELDFVCMFGSAFQWHYPTPETGNYITIVVDLVRPVSEPGEVTLNSSDPLVQPNINLNFFANDLDIIAMREGIRFTYDVLTKGDGFKYLVECEYPWEMPLHSDSEMRRAVLDRCQTAFHPCGTARLSKSIEQGVVDPQLRVHGIKQLRVADASVVPVIPDCRIQNSIYMVGENCADMIKAAHQDLYQ
ncbi:choline dehydrogenase [Aspergillus sclerotioniger CBS 115572]|uniref:Choline dehydrogenase n=1 Tax=Aspergillus sclerotioniger CBS 115572 TaxID=1450535 RepID=A0A317VC32_9EURO|nr:choline dehydrogenase [Aspergillus sclerotioniger CBS 115572]PWY71786.1 choline dehydrogenase [Aspergillus sclerotioniger CBS 115572]